MNKDNENWTEQQKSQEVERQVQQFKTLSNSWSYFETPLAAVVALVGMLMILNDITVYGIITTLLGTILFLYAEIKRLNNLFTFHTATLWSAILGHNDAISLMDATMDVLKFYEKAEEVLKEKEEEGNK